MTKNEIKESEKLQVFVPENLNSPKPLTLEQVNALLDIIDTATKLMAFVHEVEKKNL